MATIGKQGGLSEGFTDTLLLAVYASKSYFFSYTEDSQNYGMVLTPDANHSVKWSIPYSEERESSVIFRSPHWQDSLFPTTNVKNPDKRGYSQKYNGINSTNVTVTKEIFNVSGKKIRLYPENKSMIIKRPFGIYIERESDGSLKRKLDSRIN